MPLPLPGSYPPHNFIPNRQPVYPREGGLDILYELGDRCKSQYFLSIHCGVPDHTGINTLFFFASSLYVITSNIPIWILC